MMRWGRDRPYWRTEGALPGAETGDSGKETVCDPTWRRTPVLRLGSEGECGFKNVGIMLVCAHGFR